MKRGVMNSVVRTRAMRFEWQKLVTPLTPKAVVAEWQAKDGEIQSMLSQARGTPLTGTSTIPPLDHTTTRPTNTPPTSDRHYMHSGQATISLLYV